MLSSPSSDILSMEAELRGEETDLDPLVVRARALRSFTSMGGQGRRISLPGDLSRVPSMPGALDRESRTLFVPDSAKENALPSRSAQEPAGGRHPRFTGGSGLSTAVPPQPTSLPPSGIVSASSLYMGQLPSLLSAEPGQFVRDALAEAQVSLGRFAMLEERFKDQGLGAAELDWLARLDRKQHPGGQLFKFLSHQNSPIGMTAGEAIRFVQAVLRKQVSS